MEPTIAAIATALSPSGLSIIRLSGVDAVEIADRVFCGSTSLSEAPSHTIHYGHIVDREEVIDEVMVLLMRGPKSYTREDTVEIDCHGGVYVTRRILEAVLHAGAALAAPGEFTKRAFLNGRIDLSEAEAVIDVINSQNDFALRSSLSQLSGKLSGRIRSIRDLLLNDMAMIESALDDPEHFSLEGMNETFLSHADQATQELKELKRRSGQGRILKEGIRTVIVGKPNVGKSSLLNLLSGTDRAIVTDQEGTTRDILEEHIRIGSLTLNLIDTAGIRETEDIVEKIGVERAKEVMSQADLVLFVIDISLDLDDNDRKIFSMISEKNTIIILNKSDLEHKITKEEILQNLKDQTNIPILNMSARFDAGTDELEETLMQLFSEGKIDYDQELFVTNERHLALIDEALSSLAMVRESIQNELPEDFYTIDLMNAYSALGSIIGEAVEEDLVNRIFEKFCMGK
ncbi:MAG: tRNA uridine-5-carboxymethylaminomethyl(34) synthesis GTPase MnmE [Lachnospiraceae bacterium]|nr:tRNA uridine-5-carboxymethylaminomethyl(34) synthesis GTPase MnmE [Lachnospiraceae bacterium]